jgi:hypothetical protein
MFAFPYVVHLLADEFASLRRRRLTGSLVAPSAPDRALLGHVALQFSKQLITAARIAQQNDARFTHIDVSVDRECRNLICSTTYDPGES